MTTFLLGFITVLLLAGGGLFLIENAVHSRRWQMLLRLALLASVLGYLAWTVWR